MIRAIHLVQALPVLAAFAFGMVLLAIGVDRLAYPYQGDAGMAYVGACAFAGVLSSALIGALTPRRR